MNLVPVNLSRAEQDGTFGYAIERSFSPAMELGLCIRQKPVINSNQTSTCRRRVTGLDGYADTEGAPFKAYYCASCAKELLRH